MFCDNALMEEASRVSTKLNAKRWAPLDELDLLVVVAFNNFFCTLWFDEHCLAFHTLSAVNKSGQQQHLGNAEK